MRTQQAVALRPCMWLNDGYIMAIQQLIENIDRRYVLKLDNGVDDSIIINSQRITCKNKDMGSEDTSRRPKEKPQNKNSHLKKLLHHSLLLHPEI